MWGRECGEKVEREKGGRESRRRGRGRKGPERVVVGQALGRLKEGTNRNRKTQREWRKVDKWRRK